MGEISVDILKGIEYKDRGRQMIKLETEKREHTHIQRETQRQRAERQ